MAGRTTVIPEVLYFQKMKTNRTVDKHGSVIGETFGGIDPNQVRFCGFPIFEYRNFLFVLRGNFGGHGTNRELRFGKTLWKSV